MKKLRFKYKLSKWLTAILIIALIFAVTGIAYTAYSLIEYTSVSSRKTTTFAILLALSVVLAIIIFSVMFGCKYVIKKGCLYFYMGFVFSKSKVESITQISHFTDCDKLVVYFEKGYSVIMINPTEFDNFVEGLQEIKEKIPYYAQKSINRKK